MACEDLAARSASAFTATGAEPQKFSSEKKQIGKLSECVTLCLLSQEWGWDVVRLKDLKATCQTLLDKYEAILPAPTTAPRTTKPILVFIDNVVITLWSGVTLFRRSKTISRNNWQTLENKSDILQLGAQPLALPTKSHPSSIFHLWNYLRSIIWWLIGKTYSDTKQKNDDNDH